MTLRHLVLGPRALNRPHQRYQVWQSCRPLSWVTKCQNFAIMSGSLSVVALDVGWGEGGGGGGGRGDAAACRWMWVAAARRATAGLVSSGCAEEISLALGVEEGVGASEGRGVLGLQSHHRLCPILHSPQTKG